MRNEFLSSVISFSLVTLVGCIGAPDELGPDEDAIGEAELEFGDDSFSEHGGEIAESAPGLEHQLCTGHPDGSFACLSADHLHLFVCDQHADGHYAYIRTYRWGAVQPPLYDNDGAGGGCSWYAANVGSLDSFNICVQYEGCGNPIYWWQY
jgi:hypothetical protein